MEAERTILAFETKTRAQEGSKGCYQSLPRFLPPKGFAGQRACCPRLRNPSGSSLPLLRVWPVEGAASPRSHSSLGFAT